MGSRIHDDAIRAVEELRANGWLEDGSLQKVRLHGANLEAAFLVRANLQGAILVETNLQRARLWYANLQATLLWNAKLQGANLKLANLQEANMGSAKLQSANFLNANLLKSLFEHAQFDETTILPDNSHWTPKTDMHRFTDPSHPQFWRSDDPDSPAYRGKTDQ